MPANLQKVQKFEETRGFAAIADGHLKALLTGGAFAAAVVRRTRRVSVPRILVRAAAVIAETAAAGAAPPAFGPRADKLFFSGIARSVWKGSMDLFAKCAGVVDQVASLCENGAYFFFRLGS